MKKANVSEKLNLSNVKYKMKTLYTGRKSDTPMLSVTKGGMATLNVAFSEKFLKGKQNLLKLYIQIVEVKGKNYFVFSEKKRDHFFPMLKQGKNNNGWKTMNKSLFSILGKTGKSMRYGVEEVPVSDSSVRALKLTLVTEDMAVAIEKANFEIHTNYVG